MIALLTNNSVSPGFAASATCGLLTSGTFLNCLLAFLAITDRGGATTISSATIGGVAATAFTAFNHASGYDARLFYRAVGTLTGTVTTNGVVTYSDGNTKPAVVGAAWSGVDQTTPLYNIANGSATSQSQSWTIASAVNDLVAAFFASNPSTTAITPVAGTTQDWDVIASGINFRMDALHKAGAPSVTVGATTPSNVEWFGTGFSLTAAAAAAGSVDRGRTLARGLGRGLQ